MRKSTFRWLAIVLALVVYLGMAACSGENQADAEGAGEHAAAESGGVEGADSEASGEHARSESGGEHGEGGEGGERREGREGGEHARSEGGGEHGEGGEGDEHGEGGEGEESGEYIGSGDTWDATRSGARLVLAFDPTSDAFVGSVQNTTSARLCAVRVEVHLSTGTELGPTERTDVGPGQTIEVRLPASGEAFDAWTAHPELSPC